MKNKIIKLGVTHNEKGDYSFDIYRLDRKDNNKLKRLTWSQLHHSLGYAMLDCFNCNQQSEQEYREAKRIEVIPLGGLGQDLHVQQN